MVQAIVINGLMYGGVYALLALGFSLIFGVARILNMGHTAFYMLCAFVIFILWSMVGMNLYLSVLLSLLLTTLIGAGTYKLFIEPVREHMTTVMLITIALGMAIQESLLLAFKGEGRGIPTFIPGYQVLLGVRVSNQHLLTLGVVLVILLIVWLVLSRTKLGLAIRATAQDREAANLVGIDVGMICFITMTISIALAALCGAVIAPLLVIEPNMWMHPLIMILGIVIIGGLGSVKGSIAAAFLVGFIEVLVTFLLPEAGYLKTVIAMVAMMLVLLIRPEGLFGVAFEEERL